MLSLLLGLVLSVGSWDAIECSEQIEHFKADDDAYKRCKNCHGAEQHFVDAKAELDACVNPQGTVGINEGFDAHWYLLKYPDILAAFGWNSSAAKNHYMNNGVREARIGSIAFDPVYYLNRYPDLRAAFGATGYASALNHWITRGIDEGRVASPFFDINYYISQNPDVARTYPNQPRAILRHAMTWGLIEARNMSNTYNWKAACTTPSQYRSCIYNFVKARTR